MWTTWLDPAVYTRLCLALLHSLWQTTAIAAVVVVLGQVLRRRPAQWRYVLQVVGLAASLAALPVTLVLIDVAPTPPTPPSPPLTVAENTTREPLPTAPLRSDDRHVGVVRPAMEDVRNAGPAEFSRDIPQRSVAPPAAAPAATVAGTELDVARRVPQNASPWRTAAVACCAGYALGVLVMFARLARGIRAERRLCLAAQAISGGPAIHFVAQLARRWSMRAVPAVALARDIAVPKVVGLLRPMILLPTSILAGLSVAELEMVLAHELAHVRRHDVWVSLLQRLAEVVLFFNPAVWYLSRRTSALREDCCDDLVCASLTEGQPGASVRYAQALLHVAELCCAGPQRDALAAALAGEGPLAAAALGRNPSELKRRIARILGEPLPRPLGLSRGGVAMLGMLCAALVVGPVAWTAAGPKPTAATVSSETAAAQAGEATDDKPPAASELAPNATDSNADQSAPQPGRDLYGDALPAGVLARLGTVRFRPGNWVFELAFTRDSSTVICAEHDASAISLWNVKDGRLIRRLPANARALSKMDVSPDGKLVAAVGARFEGQIAVMKALEVWELDSGNRVSEFAWDERGGCNAVKFLPDGAGLLTASGDGTLRIFDHRRGIEILNQTMPQTEIQDVALSPDGTKAALATRQGLYVWDWANAQPPRRIGPDGQVLSVAWSPDGTAIAIARDRAHGALVDPVRGDEIRSIEIDEGRNLSFSRDGKLLAAGVYRAIAVCDVATGKRVRTIDRANHSTLCVALSPDARLIAASGTDGVISIWNVATGEELSKSPVAHSEYVTQIGFASEEDVFTSSDDGSIRAWDPATGKQQFVCGHTKWASALAVSHNGKLIASSSLDDSVRLWDATDGRELLRLPGHGASGGPRWRPVAFASDDKRFASWGEDLHLRTYDVKTGKVESEHFLRPSGVKISEGTEEGMPVDVGPFDDWRRNLNEAVFSPDARTLALLIGPKLHIFDVASGKEAHLMGVDVGNFYHAAISPDGKRLLATGSGPNTIIKRPDGRMLRNQWSDYHILRLWNLENGELLSKLNVPGDHPDPVAFSSDGRLFATATRPAHPDGWYRTSTIRVWDAAAHTQLKTIEGLRGYVRSLAFSPSGKRLAAGMSDTTGLVWDLDLAADGKRLFRE